MEANKTPIEWKWHISKRHPDRGFFFADQPNGIPINTGEVDTAQKDHYLGTLPKYHEDLAEYPRTSKTIQL
jgi:hypothetical protein